MTTKVLTHGQIPNENDDGTTYTNLIPINWINEIQNKID